MPAILSSESDDGLPKYTVIGMGRNWKKLTYINNDTGNEFKGEPETGIDQPFIEGFEDEGMLWDIAYSFKGQHEPVEIVDMNGKLHKYGTDVNNDRLYYILVNAFNGGIDFVAEYLRSVMPYTVGEEIRSVIRPALDKYKEYVVRKDKEYSEEVSRQRHNITRRKDYREQKALFDENIEEANQNIAKTTGTFDKRTVAGKKVWTAMQKMQSFLSALDNIYFKVRGKTWENESEEVSEILRKDFVASMQSGTVPLESPLLSDRTVAIKTKMVGFAYPKFVASSNFVNSIEFRVRIKNPSGGRRI